MSGGVRLCREHLRVLSPLLAPAAERDREWERERVSV